MNNISISKPDLIGKLGEDLSETIASSKLPETLMIVVGNIINCISSEYSGLVAHFQEFGLSELNKHEFRGLIAKS